MSLLDFLYCAAPMAANINSILLLLGINVGLILGVKPLRQKIPPFGVPVTIPSSIIILLIGIWFLGLC